MQQKQKSIMKPSSTSTASLVFAMLMVVASNPLTSTAWARSDERDLRMNTASKSSDASVLRGVTSHQDERTLAKGGNGGGKPNRDDSTPSPTAAVTPAPTPTPPPVFQYPPVPYSSCGTRAPSTPAPSPAPTAHQCENPPDGECNGGNQCCEGYSCKGKRCRLNVRRLGEEHKVTFEETATEERKLGDCVDHRCNEHENAVLCDIASSRPASTICNYGGGEYTASVVTCEGDVELCCEDGNGGYYYGLACWINYQGATCCPKGYTRISSGCVPMNCCDGDVGHQERYCPGKC